MLLRLGIIALMLIRVGAKGIVGPPPPPPPPTDFDFFVAPDGSPSNPGTLALPWSKAHAQSATNTAITAAKHKIGVRAGVYRGDWNFTVSGDATFRPVFRNYNNERWVVDNPITPVIGWQVNSSYLDLWGFIYQYTSSLIRQSNEPIGGATSAPPDIDYRWMKTLRNQGAHNRFINYFIHNVGDAGTDENVAQAFNSWWYGGWIGWTGWGGIDRNHAYAHYVQNSHILGKRFEDEVYWGCFGAGVKVGGSGGSENDYFTFRGICSFNHGGYGPFPFMPPFYITGGQDTGSRENLIEDSVFGVPGQAINLGDTGTYGAAAGPATFQRNLVLAERDAITFSAWPVYTMLDNEIQSRLGVSSGGRAIFGFLPTNGEYANWIINRNKYSYPSGPLAAFFHIKDKSGVGFDYTNIAALVAGTGWEQNGTLTNSLFLGVKTRYRPNQFEPGRGNIYCVNWDRLATVVSVDPFQAGLRAGDKFVIHHHTDLFGAPVASGVYDGLTLTLPVSGYTTPDPLGWTGGPQAGRPDDIHAFLVRKVSDFAIPAAPSGLAAASAGTDRINLTWTSNSSTEKGFVIERKQVVNSQTFWTWYAITLAGVTAYQVKELAHSTLYEWRVRSYGEAGHSAPSSSASATTDTPVLPADIPQLVTGLGGDAAVPAFYDRRIRVTHAGGKGSKVEDARGEAGFGPAAVQTVFASQPDRDPDTGELSFDGIDDILLTAASSLFDVAAGKTLVLVGSSEQTASGYALALRESNNATWLGLRTARPSNYTFEAFTGGTPRTVSVASLARRVVFVSATGTTLKAEVPSLAAASGSYTTLPAANRILAIGGFQSSIFSKTKVSAVIVVNGAISDAQRDLIRDWAVANHAAVLA